MDSKESNIKKKGFKLDTKYFIRTNMDLTEQICENGWMDKDFSKDSGKENSA